jgi:hypothetical protein
MIVVFTNLILNDYIFWPLNWVVFALLQLDFTKALLSFGCVSIYLCLCEFLCVCISLFCVHCVFIWLCISPWNLGHHIVCLCVRLCLRLGNVWVCLHVCVCVLWQVLMFSCGFVNVWIVCVCMRTMFSCSNDEQQLCSMSKRFYWHVCASSYNFIVCKPCTYISYFHFVNLLLLQSSKDFFSRNPLWKSRH